MVKKLAKGMIPLGQKGNEEYDKSVRAKLKGSASNKRKISAKIRAIKDMSDERVDGEVYKLISNPELSATQIQMLIQRALERGLNDTNFINLINTCIKKHSAIFGNKVDMNAKVNMDEVIDGMMDKWRKERMDMIIEEKKVNKEDIKDG